MHDAGMPVVLGAANGLGQVFGTPALIGIGLRRQSGLLPLSLGAFVQSSPYNLCVGITGVRKRGLSTELRTAYEAHGNKAYE